MKAWYEKGKGKGKGKGGKGHFAQGSWQSDDPTWVPEIRCYAAIGQRQKMVKVFGHMSTIKSFITKMEVHLREKGQKWPLTEEDLQDLGPLGDVRRHLNELYLLAHPENTKPPGLFFFLSDHCLFLLHFTVPWTPAPAKPRPQASSPASSPSGQITMQKKDLENILKRVADLEQQRESEQRRRKKPKKQRENNDDIVIDHFALALSFMALCV